MNWRKTFLIGFGVSFDTIALDIERLSREREREEDGGRKRYENNNAQLVDG